MIIDYGMGNVGSVAAALEYLGANYFVSNKNEDLINASAFILPGVGAFPTAMKNLKKLNLVDGLNQQVLQQKKPFFGICLGMQLLAKDSVEQGFSTGLGWLDAHVLPLEPVMGLRIPHVGWNNITFCDDNMFFEHIDSGANFYFDHSYQLRCSADRIAATFEYGSEYVAAVSYQNIIATQFHPEKSQRNGLKMLRNFLNLV